MPVVHAPASSKRRRVRAASSRPSISEISPGAQGSQPSGIGEVSSDDEELREIILCELRQQVTKTQCYHNRRSMASIL